MSITPVKKPNSIPAAIAAIRTLERLGFTYTEGAEQWRPPLGEPPEYINKPLRDGWRWEGDGSDHLQSMGNNMVIEITAAQLRALLGWKDTPNKTTATAERAVIVRRCWPFADIGGEQ